MAAKRIKQADLTDKLVKVMMQIAKFFAFLIFVSVFVSACDSSAARKYENSNLKPTPPVLTNSGKSKIVAFGDSLTAGFGLAEKESYPYLLQEKLNSGGYDFEVVNAGVSGDTTLGGVERIDWVLGQENVKVLILELGANDLLRRIPVKQTKANLKKIIEKAQAKNVEVLLCGMLAPPSVGADYQKEYINLFPDLATEYKIKFLPFILENIALEKNLNQADGIHPNAAGEKIMTENVWRALEPMLKKQN